MRTQPPAPNPIASQHPLVSELAEPAAEPGLFAATLQALLEPPAPDEPVPDEEDEPAIEETPAEETPARAGADPAPEPAASGLPVTVAQAPVGELEPARRGSPAVAAPPEPLAQEMLRQVQVVSTPDAGAGLHLELETPRCARVGLDLRLERGRIEASFVAGTREAQALLRAGVAELEAGLLARGLTVGSLRVTLRGEEGARERQRPRSPTPPPRDPRESSRRGRGGGDFVV